MAKKISIYSTALENIALLQTNQATLAQSSSQVSDIQLISSQKTIKEKLANDENLDTFEKLIYENIRTFEDLAKGGLWEAAAKGLPYVKNYVTDPAYCPDATAERLMKNAEMGLEYYHIVAMNIKDKHVLSCSDETIENVEEMMTLVKKDVDDAIDKEADVNEKKKLRDHLNTLVGNAMALIRYVAEIAYSINNDMSLVNDAVESIKRLGGEKPGSYLGKIKDLCAQVRRPQATKNKDKETVRKESFKAIEDLFNNDLVACDDKKAVEFAIEQVMLLAAYDTSEKEPAPITTTEAINTIANLVMLYNAEAYARAVNSIRELLLWFGEKQGEAIWQLALHTLANMAAYFNNEGTKVEDGKRIHDSVVHVFNDLEVRFPERKQLIGVNRVRAESASFEDMTERMLEILSKPEVKPEKAESDKIEMNSDPAYFTVPQALQRLTDLCNNQTSRLAETMARLADAKKLDSSVVSVYQEQIIDTLLYIIFSYQNLGPKKSDGDTELKIWGFIADILAMEDVEVELSGLVMAKIMQMFLEIPEKTDSDGKVVRKTPRPSHTVKNMFIALECIAAKLPKDSDSLVDFTYFLQIVLTEEDYREVYGDSMNMLLRYVKEARKECMDNVLFVLDRLDQIYLSNLKPEQAKLLEMQIAGMIDVLSAVKEDTNTYKLARANFCTILRTSWRLNKEVLCDKKKKLVNIYDYQRYFSNLVLFLSNISQGGDDNDESKIDDLRKLVLTYEWARDNYEYAVGAELTEGDLWDYYNGKLPYRKDDPNRAFIMDEEYDDPDGKIFDKDK